MFLPRTWDHACIIYGRKLPPSVVPIIACSQTTPLPFLRCLPAKARHQPPSRALAAHSALRTLCSPARFHSGPLQNSLEFFDVLCSLSRFQTLLIPPPPSPTNRSPPSTTSGPASKSCAPAFARRLCLYLISRYVVATLQYTFVVASSASHVGFHTVFFSHPRRDRKSVV